MYGANCQSECHCAEGVSCLPDTGECDGRQCHHDWYGVNCQSKCQLETSFYIDPDSVIPDQNIKDSIDSVLHRKN